MRGRHVVRELFICDSSFGILNLFVKRKWVAHDQANHGRWEGSRIPAEWSEYYTVIDYELL
jgi:hypothetical protein